MLPTEIRWIQAVRHPTSKQRDPIQGEFFNTESITTLAAKLTREGIGQNPMDAAIADPVQVRVYVSGNTGALSSEVANRYFHELRQHVAACDPSAHTQFDEPCRFLVIEDFNTTGLRGDVAATEEPPPENPNDFFYFFRAEGKSGKSGADRGRWGVGKYVFPMASHINTFFGLTVREEDAYQPLLMGQTVLKNHSYAGVSYEPDGWWSDTDWRDVPIPLHDAELIADFRENWNVSRDRETGLSIVIPYIREDLGADDLKRAIVLDYYLAIIEGKFTATVASAENPDGLVISHDTLEQVVATLSNVEEREELGRQISLARWHTQLTEDEFIYVAQSAGNPVWSTELIAPEDRERIRTALDQGNMVAVRVPVEVRYQGATTGNWSFFDVVFSPEPGYTGRPQFVREGLIVSEVNSSSLPSLRCSVIVNDDDLAQMVGDAEGPAHTNWSPQRLSFSGKYRYGRQWLSFIKRAPAAILSIVREEDEQADRSLLARFFPTPAAQPAPQPPAGGDEPGPGPTSPPAPPPPRPRSVRVTRIQRGFAVHLTGERTVRTIRIRVAYDRRQGNPFAHWRVEDFDLISPAFSVEIEGGTLDVRKGNQLVVSVANTDNFSLQVRGFDENRDLRVDTDVEFGGDDAN